MSIKISKKTKGEVFSKTNNRCYYCGIDLDFFNFPAKNAAVIDHVIPVSKGGSDSLDNLKSLCIKCHREIQGYKINPKGQGKLNE